jgi:flagellar biosynthesis protein FliR
MIPIDEVFKWIPAFAVVLTRIAAIMLLLPALGEQVVPVTVRIGMALSLTILLLPELGAAIPSNLGSVADFANLVVREMVTGIWFGWLVRQTVLVLPIFGQISSYLMGLSSVLQPDAELGPQSTALSKAFENMAPLIVLTTGLYKPPLLAISSLFHLIPPGNLLPNGDAIAIVISTVGQTFRLAVQLASPLILGTILWHLAIGLIGRIVSRIQLYFATTPGQIVGGFAILVLTTGGIIDAWQEGVGLLMSQLTNDR